MKAVVTLIFLGLISIALCAVSIGDYSDKNHPGKCNIDGRILPPGIHQSPTECERISCGDNGFAERASCGKKMIRNCIPGELVDKTKDYPQCCLRYFNCNGEIVKA
uniref:Single domain-containing protein n=1 Tax=Megaselia scalaris TaxID=36166 RepID=T1GJM4_MEGSC